MVHATMYVQCVVECVCTAACLLPCVFISTYSLFDCGLGVSGAQALRDVFTPNHTNLVQG